MLRPEAEFRIEQFLKTVAQAQQSLLLLDYDGTLAPFCRERDQAFPYPGSVHLLEEIVGSGRTRVVIISGRDTNETVPLLGVAPVPEVWGLHGLQRRKPDGKIETVRIDERYLTLCPMPTDGSTVSTCGTRPSSRPAASQFIGAD